MKPYYQDDFITLYHGDCLQHLDVLDQAGVMVTDPPYGIRWMARPGGYKGGKGNSKGHIKDAIAGDTDISLRDDVLEAWGNRPAIVFGSWRMPRPANTHHRLIWHKKGSNPGPLNAAFMSNDEEIYITGEGKWVKSAPPLRTVITTEENRSNEVRKIGHPTPKPVGLMETLIERCPPEWVIVDPFAGSGSTLRAAKNLGRKAIGFEIEEKYCEITAKRLAQEVLFVA